MSAAATVSASAPPPASSSFSQQCSDPQPQQQQQQQQVEAEERAWLRACLYALQGISGERIRFIIGGACCDDDDDDDDGANHSMEEASCLSVRVRLLPPPSSTMHRHSNPLPHPQQHLPPLDYARNSRLGSGARDAIHLCGETGWLFRQIQAFVQEAALADHDPAENAGGGGAVERALARALQGELQTHQTALSDLAVASDAVPHLRALVAHTTPLRHRLKLLATVVCAGPSRRGGGGGGDRLLTHLYRHTRHGDHDGAHGPLLRRLLAQAAQPWFHWLFQWTMDGRLPERQQPPREQPESDCFFVQAAHHLLLLLSFGDKASASTDRNNSSGTINLWHEGYTLDRSKVPEGILEEDCIDTVFLIGKGVNYIRRCLDDPSWSLLSQLVLLLGEEEEAGSSPSSSSISPMDPSSRQQLRAKLGFSYDAKAAAAASPTASSSHNLTLRSTLKRSAALVHSHILQSLRNEHGLMDHLFAIKQFLLLGQGDFCSALVDGIHTEYQHHAGGISGIYRHNLAAIVENALQSTNASGFAHSVLERLQVELVLLDPGDGDGDDDAQYLFASPQKKTTRSNTGTTTTTAATPDTRTVWDIFTLDYTVPDPLVAVVHAEAMNTYRRMFRFLFGLKRVEYLLDFTWRQSSILQRALHSNAQHLLLNQSNNAAYAQAVILLRQVAMTRQSMMHFVGNVKSYLMFEVLEGGWKRLVPAVEKAETLDQVIEAHDKYLHAILRKSLLRHSSETTMGIIADRLDLSGKLEGLLQLTGDFCSYQEELFEEALEAADRAAEKRREAEYLAKHGSWGFSREKEAAEQETCFGLSNTTKLEELDRLTREFNHQIYSLLQALDSKLNGSPAWEFSGAGDTTSATPVSPSGESVNDNDDLDSLRFLASQLDHNKYYGVASF